MRVMETVPLSVMHPVAHTWGYGIKNPIIAAFMQMLQRDQMVFARKSN